METVIMTSGEAEFNGSRVSLNQPNLSPCSRRNSNCLTKNCPVSDETDQNSSWATSRVTVNVCGRRFEVPVATLTKHPETLLGDGGKLRRFYDATRDEYFFNRDQSCFKAILRYYQSGILRRPVNVPLDAFVTEVRFFELHRDALIQLCASEGFDRKRPESLPDNPIFRKIWELVEIPESSVAAKIFAVFSVLVIILSVIVFCLETLPDLQPSVYDLYDSSPFTKPLFIIESLCIAWFTLEFLIRFITCPSKKLFMKSPLNVIDLIAIVPYYIDLALMVKSEYDGDVDGPRGHAGSLAVLRVLRIVRVFRIFKVSRHSKGLQILGRTFAVSMQEMGLLLLFLGIGVVLFSSGAYYAELGLKDTHFTSIPEGFWWAVVTMTTVGYGDMAPKGVFGKMIGTVCAVSGLIAIALPVPVIVSNFNTIYQREKERPFVEDLLSDTGSAMRLNRRESTLLTRTPRSSKETEKSSLMTEQEVFLPDRK